MIEGKLDPRTRKNYSTLVLNPLGVVDVFCSILKMVPKRATAMSTSAQRNGIRPPIISTRKALNLKTQ